MKKNIPVIVTLVLISLWVIMFLAGSDVWNGTGRIPIWKMQGPVYSDLKVFVGCFYALAGVLVLHLVYGVCELIKKKKA